MAERERKEQEESLKKTRAGNRGVRITRGTWSARRRRTKYEEDQRRQEKKTRSGRRPWKRAEGAGRHHRAAGGAGRGAPGAKALSHINQIAMEQARRPQQCAARMDVREIIGDGAAIRTSVRVGSSEGSSEH
jgi:hypothetical protein